MSTTRQYSLSDLEQIVDEIRFVADSISATTHYWDDVGIPTREQSISLYGFFTSERLLRIAEDLEQIRAIA